MNSSDESLLDALLALAALVVAIIAIAAIGVAPRALSTLRSSALAPAVRESHHRDTRASTESRGRGPAETDF